MTYALLARLDESVGLAGRAQPPKEGVCGSHRKESSAPAAADLRISTSHSRPAALTSSPRRHMGGARLAGTQAERAWSRPEVYSRRGKAEGREEVCRDQRREIETSFGGATVRRLASAQEALCEWLLDASGCE